MITLTTLSSLNDAFVLRSMLEASEIPSFIPDENTCQMDWGYINAIGGVRVQVPKEFLESAQVVLEEFKGNLSRDLKEVSDPTPNAADATVFAEKATVATKESSAGRSTSHTVAALMVLALGMIAVIGFFAMRAQEKKAALTAAIGAYDTGDYDRAIAEYSRAIEFGTTGRSLFYDRGLAYVARGDKTQSMADYDRAIADFSNAIESDPYFANAYDSRGNVYLDKGEYDKAIADFSRVIQLEPNSATGYQGRGMAYVYTNECDKALADLNQAIQFNSKDELSYFNRGQAYRQKHDYAKAIADYDQSLLLNPKYEIVYTNRGFLRDERGEYDLAIADDTQALQLNPRDEYAAVNRGKAYSDKGDVDRAMMDFTKAIEIDPKDRQAYFNRASTYADQGNYAKAIVDYEQAILVKPNNPDAYLNLAGILATCPKADLRDGKKAVVLATRAFELSGGKEPFALDTLAVAYAEAGDFANAVKWENKYLESSGQKAGDLADARKRLKLFQNHHAYHEVR